MFNYTNVGVNVGSKIDQYFPNTLNNSEIFEGLTLSLFVSALPSIHISSVSRLSAVSISSLISFECYIFLALLPHRVPPKLQFSDSYIGCQNIILKNKRFF